jgi:hypothetical protein
MIDWPVVNAILNLAEIGMIAFAGSKFVGLLNSRKHEIDSLHEEIHQKNDLLQVRAERISFQDRQIEEYDRRFRRMR